ncbi:MAG: thiamine pyrophosphate-binding protein, partial [Candidatus Firestonebacteria bacterium]|nr:thiamine pyrophosphate-binding protein [Candidatus Firestonebacteria bacterium]
DLYWFMQVLTAALPEGAVCVAGNGTACVTLFQAGIVKKHQRIFWNSGCASMGYDLPAALGAAFGNKGREVVCLAGDGSLQMNLQELATLAHHRLPIKLFYLNNDGYSSIKQTQDNFFEGRRLGVDGKTGVGFPDILKIAQAYGLPSVQIGNHDRLEESVRQVLETPGPVVCEVKLIPDYIFSPKLSSEKKPDGRILSKPLEDMYPFLSREEFRGNMLVPPLPED